MKKKIYSLLALCLLSFGMAQAAEIYGVFSNIISDVCADEIDPSQDIDRINQEPKAKSDKFIRDGQLLIESNGKTFNTQGAKIQ